MSHTFKIDVAGDVYAVLAQVNIELAKSGGALVGLSAYDGQFHGSGVEGLYHISGSTATITINKKPFIVSMKYIEEQIRKYFA